MTSLIENNKEADQPIHDLNLNGMFAICVKI